MVCQTYLASLLLFFPSTYTHTSTHIYTFMHTYIHLLHASLPFLALASVGSFLQCCYSPFYLPQLSHVLGRLFKCLSQETLNLLKTIKYMILWLSSYFFNHSIILKIWNRLWCRKNFVCLLNAESIYYLEGNPFFPKYICNNYDFNTLMEEATNFFPSFSPILNHLLAF